MPIQLNAMLMRLVYKVLMETLSYRIWRDLIYSVAWFNNTSTVQLISSSDTFHFSCLLASDFYGHKTRCCSQKNTLQKKKIPTRHNTIHHHKKCGSLIISLDHANV